MPMKGLLDCIAADQTGGVAAAELKRDPALESRMTNCPLAGSPTDHVLL